MPEVFVENEFGVVEGLDYENSRLVEAALETESSITGNRIKFKPTRFALDKLVELLGASTFHPGCRFAWSHFYKEKRNDQQVEFEWVTEPYDHQREWWSIIKDMEFFSLEWEMGLGKSKTILDVMQWAYATGELDALLVVTLKDVHRKWALEEVPTHFPRGMADAVYWRQAIVENGMWTGTSRNRTSIIESDKFAVATMNFDVIHRDKGEKFAQRFLRSRKAALVVDESQYMKTPSATVTKSLTRLGKKAERRYILSGTMAPGSPLDAHSQYNFLSPKAVNGMKFHEFKSAFAKETEVPGVTYQGWEKDPLSGKSRKVEKPVKTISGYKDLDKLKTMLDPYRSRLLKSDCLDLPEKIYRMRSFEMTPAMRNAYNQMANDFMVELSGDRTMTATMAIVKMVRLHQIACGFIVPDGVDATAENAMGEPLDDKNPRIEALMQEIEPVNGKAIVWSSWRYSLREIAAALRTAYGDASVVEYHGGIDDKGKLYARNEFQQGTPRWFVGNPQSAGVGIDLTAAQDMFYYNNSYNLGLRLQSEDRFHRIGQQGNTLTITDLECLGTIDRPQLRALRDKKDISAQVSGDILKQWLTEAV